ncbi:2-hydroxychromene-2-carboxylate isomerase [Pontixanthobacter aquaemixtae]|uniref:2-hydroxychromene-2-carboxylate isomerase n=1 Tax=Pontixanthobacter aquaemixtae TaxID=1958940 RepID=A0A844ZTN4_9SPHN|nr:2-hydroxychromene-2-carboxylate isomerase [Pontixanthobacter aquaemixtae]MXO90662.1 2-hydroxychromene-2-carboxylate isomerase [Pontixanthobacter aquaemixtae]
MAENAPKTIELIFDFVSPNAYLVWQPLKELARRTGATIVITPVFLGGMHKLTGNAPPMIRDADVKGKVAYATLEMTRFIKKHGLSKWKMHPQFPFNSVTLQRMLLSLEGADRVRLVDTLLPVIWEEGVLLDDAEALGAALAAGGFDRAALMAATQDPAIKQQLIDNTSDAVERGTFGIPTFYVNSGGDDEMYFGKERLGQMEEQLSS